MKKKNATKINEIIGLLTDLEVEITQNSHYNGVASKELQLEWFHKLNKIVSSADDVYKDEVSKKRKR